MVCLFQNGNFAVIAWEQEKKIFVNRLILKLKLLVGKQCPHHKFCAAFSWRHFLKFRMRQNNFDSFILHLVEENKNHLHTRPDESNKIFFLKRRYCIKWEQHQTAIMHGLVANTYIHATHESWAFAVVRSLVCCSLLPCKSGPWAWRLKNLEVKGQHFLKPILKSWLYNVSTWLSWTMFPGFPLLYVSR